MNATSAGIRYGKLLLSIQYILQIILLMEARTYKRVECTVLVYRNTSYSSMGPTPGSQHRLFGQRSVITTVSNISFFSFWG